ncbi:MAG: DUF523 domain-containing protein [bacterium]|nr:DUF523 domain-containing protein [bacterium]
MRLVQRHDLIESWPAPTAQEPWIVMISGCMMGLACGVDGTDYGFGGALDMVATLDNVRTVAFCPEDLGLGTPRTMPDLHGGDGFGVLAGTARVLDEHGTDLTDGMIRGARAMAARAIEERVCFAILMDASGACGSQVISDGCRFDEPRRHQRGVGVATAALAQAGIPVLSQRDHRTLGPIRARLDQTLALDPDARDHHESAWVQENLPEPRVWPI